ncbi:MAG: hypothetical protein Q8Q37_00750 [bacterium]|nr:hypothetical protein [bacterium]
MAGREIAVFVNVFFMQFKFILDKRIVHVKSIRGLLSDNKSRGSLCGYLITNGLLEIYALIDDDLDEDEKIKTLIHELCHQIFPTAHHQYIYDLENILYKRFSNKQRRYLLGKIPRTSYYVRYVHIGKNSFMKFSHA